MEAPPEPLQHDPSHKRDLVVGPSQPERPYPLRLQGKVQHGFGRGSKELNCPTANLPDEAIEPYTQDMLPTGVHYGYASVHFLDGPQADANECRKQNKTHEDVFPMVMSIGWNPFYKNQRRTAEVHILHDFPRDFYGHHMKIVILGFVRPEYNYTSLDALIDDIETDKKASLASLDRDAYQAFKSDAFFNEPPSKEEASK